MNEAIKGFRTLILTGLAALLGNLDIVMEVVKGISSIVTTEMSDGGAIATLVVAVVAIKQIITDAIPRLKGVPRS